jgi:hypothetical protein
MVQDNLGHFTESEIMSYYLKSNELLWPTKEGQYDLQKKLPVGTYSVGCDPERGWFLKPITDFNIGGKIYGKTTRQAERILNTFSTRPSATGVLLTGEKGSGKTMLAKLISQEAVLDGISTLVINSPFHGDSFNTFIQSIDEPAVIVFDEFEKVFDNEQQEAILTLLDGVFPTKKLFILTVNDKWKVNTHMQNRPGRIFYMVEFKGLDAEFIREYCEDNLINKEHISQICRLTLVFESFNFDMIKGLVEELNRYNETPAQAMEMLNVKPFDASSTRHTIEYFVKGKKLERGCWPIQFRGNPLIQEEIEFSIDLTPDDDNSSIDYVLTPKHLKKIDSDAGTFTYVFNEGKSDMTVVVITRDSYKSSGYNWMDAF